MRTIGIVTARGGSQGIFRKNLHFILGKPLLAYTALGARSARRLDRLILSTDDPEIAETGRRYGLDAPFLRPAELATDDTPTLPVLRHAVATLEASGDRYDAVCLLQPTCPLRSADTIDGCIEMLESFEADSVVTVLTVPPKYNPHWVYFQNGDGFLSLSTGESQPIARRQDLPAAFHREGSVYVVRRSVLINQNSLYGTRILGFPVDERTSVNIDDWCDIERAERLLSERQQLCDLERV